MDYKILRKIFFDLFRRDKINYPECEILTFACDNDRYISLENGVKYSPLIGSFENRLEKKGIRFTSITRIASVIKGDLASGKVFSPDGAFARAMITKRIKSLFTKGYPFSKYEAKIWSSILDKTKPKAVVAILPSRELCSECRKRGIWVCDVQHGVIAEEHYWYGMKFRKTDPVQWLPNSFLVWDSGSSDVISSWAPLSAVEVKIIGNPWVDRFKKNDPEDLVLSFLKEKYQLKENKKNILLTLSWKSFGIPNGFISPELESVIKETAYDYNWYIRLHPNQIQGFASHEGDAFKEYIKKEFGEFDFNYQIVSEMPLPFLLSKINCHITWFSSVCMEASYMGIPSLVLSPEMQKGGSHESYYDYLVEAGYVTKIAPDKIQILNWIKEHVESNRLPYYNDYSAEFSEILKFLEEKCKVG